MGAKPEEDLFLRVEYDGAIATNGATLSQLRQDFAVLSANRQSTELMESFLKSSPLTNAPLESAINFALNAWSLGHMTGGHNGAKVMPELAAIGKHLQEQLTTAGIEAAVLEREVKTAIRYRALTDDEVRSSIQQ